MSNNRIHSPMNIQPNTVFNYDTSVVNEAYIRKIVLRESGTYNDQYTRSYESHLTAQGLNAITNKAAELGSGVFRPTTLTGLASNMLSISAVPEHNTPIAIPYGWGERRIVFFIEVTVKDLTGRQTEYYIQGYTDYTGVSLQSKAIDPEMVFFINNIVAANPMVGFNTPGGMQQSQSLISTDHVVFNNTIGYEPMTQFIARPTDIYLSLTSNSYGQRLSNESVNIYDQRVKLTHSPKMSKRTNAIASNYTSNILNGFLGANMNSDIESSPVEVYEGASERVQETTPTLNPFLVALSKNTASGMVQGYFKYKDLLALDPNLRNPHNNIVSFVTQGATQMNQLHLAGQTAGWQSASIETKYAASISQAVPALMLECMLSQVAFSSNNVTRTEGSTTGIFTVLSDGRAFNDSIAVDRFNIFVRRLETEVLADLSFNNQQKFDIAVRCLVFGETWVQISIDGGPYYEFVTPTFCDGLIVPVLTTNYDNLQNISSQMDILVTNVADVMSHGNERQIFSAPSGEFGSVKNFDML